MDTERTTSPNTTDRPVLSLTLGAASIPAALIFGLGIIPALAGDRACRTADETRTCPGRLPPELVMALRPDGCLLASRPRDACAFFGTLVLPRTRKQRGMARSVIGTRLTVFESHHHLRESGVKIDSEVFEGRAR